MKTNDSCQPKLIARSFAGLVPESPRKMAEAREGGPSSASLQPVPRGGGRGAPSLSRRLHAEPFLATRIRIQETV